MVNVNVFTNKSICRFRYINRFEQIYNRFQLHAFSCTLLMPQVHGRCMLTSVHLIFEALCKEHITIDTYIHIYIYHIYTYNTDNIYQREKMTLINRKMHRFCNLLPIAWENATKSIAWGETRKLVLIYLPQYRCSCGILHHIENVCLFSSIFHSMQKGCITHRMWKVLQISFHAFYRVWVLFTLNSIRFSTRFFHAFSHQHQILILWYTSSVGKFPMVQKKEDKFINLGEPGKLVSIPSLKYGYFSSIRFSSQGILH